MLYGSENPNFKHGLRDTRLFSIWSNMKTRCYNPKTPAFKDYGGRGITICDEWLNDFQAFYDWAMSNGYSDDLTIDRKDNDGNYSPDNCRWISQTKQCNNRRSNLAITLNGKTRTLMSWCNFYSINYKTVRDRLKRGWDIETALIEPVQSKFRKAAI